MHGLARCDTWRRAYQFQQHFRGTGRSSTRHKETPRTTWAGYGGPENKGIKFPVTVLYYPSKASPNTPPSFPPFQPSLACQTSDPYTPTIPINVQPKAPLRHSNGGRAAALITLSSHNLIVERPEGK